MQTMLYAMAASETALAVVWLQAVQCVVMTGIAV